MNRPAFVVLLAIACTSLTTPAPATFPYSDCKMTGAVIDRDASPSHNIINVWQEWHCTDGRDWRVNSDGSVVRITR